MWPENVWNITKVKGFVLDEFDKFLNDGIRYKKRVKSGKIYKRTYKEYGRMEYW